MSQQPPGGGVRAAAGPVGGRVRARPRVRADRPDPGAAYEPYPRPPADLWSQQTVAHGGYVPAAAAPNRTGMIVLIVLIVLVLGGGGGYAAWYVTSKRNPDTDPTAGPTAPGR